MCEILSSCQLSASVEFVLRRGRLYLFAVDELQSLLASANGVATAAAQNFTSTPCGGLACHSKYSRTVTFESSQVFFSSVDIIINLHPPRARPRHGLGATWRRTGSELRIVYNSFSNFALSNSTKRGFFSGAMLNNSRARKWRCQTW